jgi:hypothetical protein
MRRLAGRVDRAYRGGELLALLSGELWLTSENEMAGTATDVRLRLLTLSGMDRVAQDIVEHLRSAGVTCDILNGVQSR